MRNITCVLCFSFFFFFSLCSQFVLAKSPDVQLSITWQPIENNYLGKEQALSVLEIKNTGTSILPKTGWRLYFNFVRIITPKNEVSPLNVKHINGDLSCFTPGKEFGGLKPGESIRYEMISNSWIVNKSDAPQGFYLVWDTTKAIQTLGEVKLLRPADDKKFYRIGGDKEISSRMIFENNQNLADIPEKQLIKIFPTPKYYQEKPGTFSIDEKIKIAYEPRFASEARLLSEELAKFLGKNISYGVLSQVKSPAIILRSGSFKNEAYELSIGSNQLVISAGEPSGVFYGIQTLKTLLDPKLIPNGKNKVITLPQLGVKDEPRFPYRGFMLDVARNFQPKDEILRLLDVLSLYKINTFHFHLNDDEGWRLEIPSFPELTASSGKRGHIFDDEKHLQPSYGSGPLADKNSGSGYYSKDDFIEILKYAAARHITVIPEIETPGHARAAIKAMDYRYRKFMAQGKVAEAEKYLLHDVNDRSLYRSVQKWNDNVIDVSMPSVYNFLETVTDDVVALYKQAGAPLKTIHFGGDEVPNGVWEQSPSFAALQLKDNNIKSTADVWDFYFNQVNNMLKTKGLYLSGWEEVGLKKQMVDGKKKWLVNPKFANNNIHLNVWNNLLGNEDLAYRLANSGYKVIISFVSNFYFDMAYHKSFEEPGFYWGGLTELDKPFSFIPFDYLKNQQKNYLGRPLSQQILTQAIKPTDTGKKNIIGLQGQVWSETIKNKDQLEYLLMPRLLALAERAWAQSPDWAEEKNTDVATRLYNRSLSQFFNVLGKRELQRLDHYAGGFAYRIPQPGLKKDGDKVSANIQLPGFVIRFTTDGSLPDTKSPIYTGPVEDNGNLLFSAFNAVGRSGKPSKLE